MKGYDTRCYDLGRLFIGDYPALLSDESAGELAQEIQDVIEDFIARKLCGHDDGLFWTSEQRRDVAAIFRAVGVDIDILSAEAQERATTMYAEITKKLRG